MLSVDTVILCLLKLDKAYSRITILEFRIETLEY